jgi:hypothetical protein
MDLLCFLPKTEDQHKLTKALNAVLNKEDRKEMYSTITSFTSRLKQPKKMDSIVIICPENRMLLDRIIAVKDLFINTRVILVLPDRDKETITKGHTLNPRFTTFKGENYNEMAKVVKKVRNTFYRGENNRTIGPPAQRKKDVLPGL